MIGKDVEQVKEIDVTEFLIHLENNEVSSIITVGDTLKGKLKNGTQYTVMIPTHMERTFYEDYLKEKVDSGQIESYGAEPIPSEPWFITALPTIFMVLIIVVFWFAFMQQSQGEAVG